MYFTKKETLMRQKHLIVHKKLSLIAILVDIV